MIQEKRPYYDYLSQCYNNYSVEKERAFNRCKELQCKYKGFNGGINSYCINNFTYTFTFEFENKKYRAWITKTNNYLVEL